MTTLTWNHACSVGVRALDDQHGILLDTMNELRLALVHGLGRDEITALLDRLVEFTRLHFSSEERLLEFYAYPEAAAHRTEHERLLDRIRASAYRTQHIEDVHLGPLLDFLRHWYTDHIEGLDREYGSWLNERGVY